MLGSLVLLRYLVATATAAGNQCGSSAANGKQLQAQEVHLRFYEQLPGKMRKVVGPLFFRWNEGGGIRWRIK